MQSLYPNINKFYKTLKYYGFRTITPERQVELDALVEKWRTFFNNHANNRLVLLMNFTAIKLIASAKVYGLQNGDERAYFYIKIVDPDFLFLEAYECANSTQEIEEICMERFKMYDKSLIYLEKRYNEHFHTFTPDDLWARESFKR